MMYCPLVVKAYSPEYVPSSRSTSEALLSTGPVSSAVSEPAAPMLLCIKFEKWSLVWIVNVPTVPAVPTVIPSKSDRSALTAPATILMEYGLPDITEPCKVTSNV